MTREFGKIGPGEFTFMGEKWVKLLRPEQHYNAVDIGDGKCGFFRDGDKVEVQKKVIKFDDLDVGEKFKFGPGGNLYAKMNHTSFKDARGNTKEFNCISENGFGSFVEGEKEVYLEDCNED